jgi:hypothetical protein
MTNDSIKVLFLGSQNQGSQIGVNSGSVTNNFHVNAGQQDPLPIQDTSLCTLMDLIQQTQR